MTSTPSGVMITMSPFSICITCARLPQEGGDRGGEERLALADADDQRALLAGADEQVGMVGVHRDEGVVAAEVGEGGADGVGEVAVVVALDQVGDDLGVGLGGEDVALGASSLAQLGVVLDDPVEDDVDVVGAVAVRVGVLLGDAAVRGPAGVGEADRRLAPRRPRRRRRCSSASATASRRLARLPTARTVSMWPFVEQARRRRSRSRGIRASRDRRSEDLDRACRPTYPTMPHIGASFAGEYVKSARRIGMRAPAPTGPTG